jgi:hypothetical protein
MGIFKLQGRRDRYRYMYGGRPGKRVTDSGGGADGTVGKLSVMRVWWCYTSDFAYLS